MLRRASLFSCIMLISSTQLLGGPKYYIHNGTTDAIDVQLTFGGSFKQTWALAPNQPTNYYWTSWPQGGPIELKGIYVGWCLSDVAVKQHDPSGRQPYKSIGYLAPGNPFPQGICGGTHILIQGSNGDYRWSYV